MLATVCVESPDRAAEAVAALLPGAVVCRTGAGGCSVAVEDMRVLFTSARVRNDQVVTLPVATSCSVEQVIEIACSLGHHAGEVAPGTLEFWIDEGFALALITPGSAMAAPRLLAA
jgi:hypothetical protein